MANENGESRWEQLDVRWVFAQGILGGLAAGVVFGVAEMVAMVLHGHSVYTWIQLVAAIFFGNQVLGSGQITPQVLLVAIGTHLALSATYGIILALLAAVGLAATASARPLLLAGMIWGVVLWFLNFFVIAPFAFPWFDTADVATQFVTHVFFFGLPLGLFLAWRMTGLAARPSRQA